MKQALGHITTYASLAASLSDMKTAFLTCLFLIFCCVHAILGQSSQFTHNLKGTITDPDGNVIPGLSLHFKRGSKSLFAATDVNGDFQILLPPGDYEAIIEPTVLYHFKAFVTIAEKGLNPNDLKLKVDLNRVCCLNESGLHFPKPVSLPRPPYPPAARAVRATGEVIIAVKIDKDGKVISAEALNGHPLLKKVSEAAARNSRFESSESDHERQARLTYIFMGDADERKGIIRYSNLYRITVVSEYVFLDTATR